jgi:hypothetical protein
MEEPRHSAGLFVLSFTIFEMARRAVVLMESLSPAQM